MSRQPWFKFYPSDWRSDPALRMCSLAARGLWMEMLGIMHEANPRGQLLIAARPVPPEKLAALAGVPVDEAMRLLHELEEAGVFSRKKNGVIFSRRMERDEQKARKNQENGAKGGNPSLCNQKENEWSVNPQDKAQKPEARSQKLKGVSKDTPVGGPSVQGELLSEKIVLVDVTTAQAAVDAYNAMAVKAGLPTTKLLNDKRRKAIAQRVKECGGLEGWNELMLRVAASKTLTGKKIDWRANLDFIIRPSSFIKIIEGNYDDQPTPKHDKHRGYSAQDALRGLYSGG